MPRAELEGDTRVPALRVCPWCGARNFTFASFCISCGEPLADMVGGDMGAGRAPTSGAPTASDPLPAARAERTVASQHPEGTRRQITLPILRRREAVLGLLVLALVVGYALYDWQRTASRSRAYSDGVAAARSKDWDKAAASFGRADGLHDAAQRGEDARRKVQERDRLYGEALSAAAHSDWGVAAARLNQVQTIQPAYRDSEEMLAQARWKGHVGGIVYLAHDGPAQGLFILDAQDRTSQLAGSDKDSLVRAVAPDGLALVYDRPAHEEDYAPHTLPSGSAAAGAPRSGRVPVLAELSSADAGVITYIPLTGLAGDGRGVFSQNGLWWYSRPEGSGPLHEVLFYYSPYLTDPWEPIQVSPGSPQSGKRVVALDPARSRVIIAEGVGDPRGEDRQTRLYVASATGEDPRLVQTVPGEVWQASVSPDERRLLYITQENRRSIAMTVWVAPLDGESARSVETTWPRQLQTLSWSGIEMNEHLTASWLPTGTEQVVVSRVEPGKETLTVHDVDAFRGTYAWQGPPGGVHEGDVSTFSHDGAYVASRRQQGRWASLEIVGASTNATFQSSATLPAFANQIVSVRFAPLDDYVIATVRNRDGISRGTTQAVYAAHVGDDHRLGEPRRIAITNLPYDRGFPTLALPEGGSLLVYVNPARQLRAVSLDGISDALVTGYADAVWSLKAREDLLWWR